jgi:ribonuclease BN (tRNA processing enzyme)
VRLTTVGTGTVAPHPTRVCSGHLVQSGPVTLLMDCGSGVVHRLAALELPWTDITHVAITHFHADHIADLAMLCYAFRYGQLPPRRAPLTLIGPPGLRDLIDRLALVFGTWLHAPGYPMHVVECGPGEPLPLSDALTLEACAVPHTAESVAYSVSDGTTRLVYSGDTGFDLALATWAEGCNLLLLECSLPDEMAIASHLTPAQCGEVAARAMPGRLVLTHFYPPVEAVDIAGEVARHFAGSVVLATDGWFIDL